MHIGRGAACSFDKRNGFSAGLVIDVGYDDGGSFGRQPQGDGPADAGSCCGDECCLVLEKQPTSFWGPIYCRPDSIYLGKFRMNG